MNKAIKLISAALLLASTATSAHAFDGERKGLQVGIGIGAHTTALNFSDSNRPGSFDAEQRLMASISLGYGFSNKIVGFLGGKTGTVTFNDFEGTLSIAGVGATVYLSETSPSLYVTGLIGQGSISTNLSEQEDRDLRDTGPGWLAGIGYEVTNRLHLEFNYGRAELVDPNNNQNTSAMETALASINYIWY